MTLSQSIHDQHPLLWLLICQPWLSEEHLAMNILQNKGRISDLTVEITDVPHAEQEQAVSFLCEQLELPKPIRPATIFPAGPKPGKES